MRNDAWLNNQDILNWYKTPDIMEFTDDGFPILLPLKTFKLPRRGVTFLPFNYAMSNKNKNAYIHFYLQDYQFNRIWNNPMKYIDILADYEGVVMPDFSLYWDMPEPLQRFNHYRNLWFARLCQINGMTVIPSVNWSHEKSFEFCFSGLPKDSALMVSAAGSSRQKEVLPRFLTGFERMIKELEPKQILLRSVESLYELLTKQFDSSIITFVDYRKENFKNGR